MFIDSPRLQLPLARPCSSTRLASGCGSPVHVHRLASPPAAARPSMFIDSPRLQLRLARPCSSTRLACGCGSPDHIHSIASVRREAGRPGSRAFIRRRRESSHLAQKLGRTRRVADETRDLRLQEHRQLRLGAAERQRERLLPGQRPESLERADRRRSDREGVSTPARTRLADETPGAEGGARKRIDATAFDTRVESRPVAEHLDAPHSEADRHPRRFARAVQRAQCANQQTEEGDVSIALGGEPRHAFDDPGRLGQPLQILAHALERAGDVEVVHTDQLAPARIEKYELAERAELEGAPEPRAHPPGRLGDAADLAEIARIERHKPVALAQGERSDHDRGRFSERHQDVSRNPNSRSARSSRRQCRRTSTVDSRNTLMPKNDSRSRRASLPIRFSIAPPLPMRIPFCDSCSTKTVARMYRHAGFSRSVNSSTRTATAYGTSCRVW